MGLAHGYEVNQHDIEHRTLYTPTERPTICLKLGIAWSDIEEYEEKWGEIPQWQHGTVTANKIMETAELKAIRIYLKDPDGEEVDIIHPRTIREVSFDPPGCISEGYLELLTITDDPANGYWKVVWEDDGKEIFSETFLVGEEPENGEDKDKDKDGIPVILIAIGIAIPIVMILAAIYVKKRG